MFDEHKWLAWAVKNNINIVVIPLYYGAGFVSRVKNRLLKRLENLYRQANHFGFIIERGGWDLSSLLPRRYFSSRQDLFRMDSGKRRRDHHFCATNPEAINLIKKYARLRFMENPGTPLFHIWPDRSHEKAWCACPACRAFTAEEQYLMAVNAVADALKDFNPRAAITYIIENDTWIDIKPRANMILMRNIPGTSEMPNCRLAEKGREEI